MQSATAHIKCLCYGCDQLVSGAKERCAFCLDCPEYQYDKDADQTELAFTRFTITMRHYGNGAVNDNGSYQLVVVEPANDNDQEEGTTDEIEWERNPFGLWRDSIDSNTRTLLQLAKHGWTQAEINRVVVVLWDVQVLDVSPDHVLVAWHGTLEVIQRQPRELDWWIPQALEHGWSTEQIDQAIRTFSEYQCAGAWTVWAVTANGLIQTTKGNSRVLVAPPKIYVEYPTYTLDAPVKPDWCIFHGKSRPDPYCKYCPDHIERTDTITRCFCEVPPKLELDPCCEPYREQQILWMHHALCPLQGIVALKKTRKSKTVEPVVQQTQPVSKPETKPVTKTKPVKQPSTQLGLLGEK